MDTTTAPDLERELKSNLNGVTELTMNLAKLDYISSAGLRVMLMAHKTMKGSMKVTNVSEIVREVFEVTGDQDIIAIVDVESSTRLNEIIEKVRHYDSIISTRTRLILKEHYGEY